MIGESELAAQLSALDWGGDQSKSSPSKKREVVVERMTVTDPQGSQVTAPVLRMVDVAGDDPVGGLAKTPTPLDSIDVSVPGAAPRKPRVVRPRSHHKAKAFVQVDHAVEVSVPQGVPASGGVRSRRPRDTAMDVLDKYGESPAVAALFESMWREAGHEMALAIGRPKASKQDAAIGWYMFLQAMRQRDAR